MRLLVVLTCVSLPAFVSSDMCVLCQPGKFQTGLSNRPCQFCEANTFAPTAGMTTCLSCVANSASVAGSTSCACLPGFDGVNGSVACVASCGAGLVMITGECLCRAGSVGPRGGPCALCPENTFVGIAGASNCTRCADGLISASGSVSEAACVCGAGFTKNGTGGCVALGAESVVLKFEMTLAKQAGTSKADMLKDLALSVSTAYGIPVDRLTVDFVALPEIASNASRRRLLQAAVTAKYLVEVHVAFPAGTSAAEIGATQQKLSTLDGASLNVALQGTPSAKITVLGTTLKESSVAVAPSPSPPSPPSPSPPSPSPPTTPSPPSTPTTPPAGGGGDVVGIAAGAGAAGVVALLVLVCCIKSKRKTPEAGKHTNTEILAI